MSVLLAILILLLAATPVPAAVIAHAFTEQNTQQTTTSTTPVDVTGASIASGNFTAGKSYLLVVTAQLGNAVLGSRSNLITQHGSTDFAQSRGRFRANNVAGTKGVYQWCTVWTAVSGEGIKLQFWADNETAQVDQIGMLAINLSDDLAAGDWASSENTTDTGLTTTFQSGAAVTFTPGTAGHDWLVTSCTQIDPGDTTTSSINRITRSGEASSTLPEARLEAAVNTFQDWQFMLSRVFTLGATSNTFTEESAATAGTAHTRLNSFVFALNLNAFRDHASAYAEADVALSTTDYATEIQTASITPSVTSDVVIWPYFGWDKGNNSRELEFRVQVDGADQPAGQTTDNYQLLMGGDNTDEDPVTMITLVSMTAAAHTVDVDGSVESTAGAPAAQHRSLALFTMELPEAAPSGPPLGTLPTLGVGR